MTTISDEVKLSNSSDKSIYRFCNLLLQFELPEKSFLREFASSSFMVGNVFGGDAWFIINDLNEMSGRASKAIS